ncbi:EpsI family protein [Paucibacter sp. APW11]|uniref:EpsI family protein n=1 Tax=Roseateles aquae TaxID=3077235 RepID=A0ABU3PG21_9BURK|nr:exosortase-associated protein EpsI, B-type [Paucibacter sp. APW11]MDT9001325.1 EpsI family protein [Paucibacter sp. APW11]
MSAEVSLGARPVRGLRLRAAAIAAVLACAAIGAYVATPTIHLADQWQKMELEQAFPTQFGDWQVDTRGPVSIVSPDLAARLNKIYNQTLSRIYVNAKGDRIMLSVAYGGDQSDGTRAHRPDVCYPAQGFQINSKSSDKLTLPDGRVLPVQRMVAQLNARIEPVTFWFAVGEYVAVSGTDQKLVQLRYGLRGMIPDGMLVRVSNITGNTAEGYALQTAFIADMSRAIESRWASRLLGAPQK